MLKVMTSAGSRWPAILPGNRHSDIWTAYLELVRCERLREDAFWAGQDEQLIELMQHCSNNVPFYRDRWNRGELFGVDELKEFPILTRSELAQNLDQLLADRLPAGHQLMGSRYTSGSTGTPVEVKTTNMTALWHSAMYLRSLEWGGLESDRSMAEIRFYEPHVAKELQRGLMVHYIVPGFAGFLKMGGGAVMDVHVSPVLQMEWLRGVRPDYLVSYPSNLAALVHQNNKAEKKLAIKRVVSMSEELTEEEQQAIEHSFGCRVVNVYSSHEAGYIASPCEENSSLLHVYEENVVLEIVDDDGKPCPPGQYGRVLLTTLHNYATPLVRYDIGDRAAWYHAKCSCGRPHRLIERPAGKRHPLFTLPNGTKKNSIGLAAGLRRIGGLRQFRVTQKSPTRVLLEYVPIDNEWNGTRSLEAAELIEEFFESREMVSVFSAYSERLPLAMNGKSPHLVTEVP